VSVVATGIDLDASVQPRPVLRVVSDPIARPRPAPAARPQQPAQTMRPTAAAPAAPAAQMPVAEPELPAAMAATDETVEMPAEPAAQPAPAAAMPAAPVAAVATERAFMPPAAVDPRSPEPARQPDPFRAADLLNGTQAPEKKRGPSLFQRMTGTARPRKEPERAERRDPIPAPAAERAAPPARIDPSAAQRRLDGVDPQDRLPSSQGEDDLLDIPAFLRRQAN
jgi:cell division protein FtsZ